MTLAAWPTYDSYKDSGVEWLGDVPSSWALTRLGGLFDERKSKVSDKDFEALSVTKNGILPQLENAAKTNDGDNRKLVNAGDFVINSRSDRKGSSGVSPLDGSVSLINIVLKPKGILPEFCNHILKSHAFVEEYYRMGHGIVADLWTTRYDEMRAIIMALPSPEEQRAIAAFLDEKCAKVDEAVRIKEEQIALLRERRQILIQQAVTRGLNPAAPMKDSGIDWIGQIPEHWEVRRSKYVFTQRKELARKDDVQLSATQSYGVIPQDEFEELVGRRVVKIQTNLEKRKHVELDDFVISMRSFQGGLERAFATGCIRSSYVILQPLQPVNADFFGYLFKSPRYIKALQVTGSFIRDGQDLNFDNFSKVDLFLPPLNEQAEIAAHIRAGCERIDNGIAIKEDQIAALKEYKTSLINAAVTGKIKVA
ncbi:restriction endonuclease subunit S [Rhodobacter xanthinilyticus]|nr:restriction endonuclease subunit S [Rhodobacter xanthinilyticus]